LVNITVGEKSIVNDSVRGIQILLAAGKSSSFEEDEEDVDDDDDDDDEEDEEGRPRFSFFCDDITESNQKGGKIQSERARNHLSFLDVFLKKKKEKIRYKNLKSRYNIHLVTIVSFFF
jgi:hypothetical protein